MGCFPGAIAGSNTIFIYRCCNFQRCDGLGSPREVAAKLPQGALSGPLSGALLGFALPACECGNVPVARRMIAVGAALGTALGFLFAAPVLNPVVLLSTWAAFPDKPWLLLLSGIRKPQLELIELNKQGKKFGKCP